MEGNAAHLNPILYHLLFDFRQFIHHTQFHLQNGKNLTIISLSLYSKKESILEDLPLGVAS